MYTNIDWLTTYLTFVPSRGRVYEFGLGCSGQLGNRSAQNSSCSKIDKDETVDH